MNEKQLKQLADMVAERIKLNPKEILTAEEAAEHLGVSKSYLYKLTMNRQIPFSKPNGKMCYFRRTDLDQWMMSNPFASSDELDSKAASYCMRNKIPV